MADQVFPRSRLVKSLAFLSVFAIAFAGSYGLWAGYRTARLYQQIKSAGRGWETPVNTHDPILGYAPIPGSRSVEMFPCGYRVPVRHDADGCRIPIDAPESEDKPRPRVLAFGCSFTYGTGVNAEETFPVLVAQRLGGSGVNAAVAGYGLAQMLLRAQDLIPRVAPDYVLVQYAPWIIDRSIDYLSPWEAHGRTPRPYFAVSKEGGIVVAPPAFATNYFDLNMSAYVNGPVRLGELASFFFRVGLPLWTYSDVQFAGFVLKRTFGTLPRLAPDTPTLIESVYGEFADLCRVNGARMIVVVLGSGGLPPDDMRRDHLDALQRVPGATVVNAYEYLYAQLPNRAASEYEQTYEIWACSPPRLIDRHPNAHAHAVIAEAICQTIAKP